MERERQSAPSYRDCDFDRRSVSTYRQREDIPEEINTYSTDHCVVGPQACNADVSIDVDVSIITLPQHLQRESCVLNTVWYLHCTYMDIRVAAGTCIVNSITS